LNIDWIYPCRPEECPLLHDYGDCWVFVLCVVNDQLGLEIDLLLFQVESDWYEFLGDFRLTVQIVLLLSLPRSLLSYRYGSFRQSGEFCLETDLGGYFRFLLLFGKLGKYCIDDFLIFSLIVIVGFSSKRCSSALVTCHNLLSSAVVLKSSSFLRFLRSDRSVAALWLALQIPLLWFVSSIKSLVTCHCSAGEIRIVWSERLFGGVSSLSTVYSMFRPSTTYTTVVSFRRFYSLMVSSASVKASYR